LGQMGRVASAVPPSSLQDAGVENTAGAHYAAPPLPYLLPRDYLLHNRSRRSALPRKISRFSLSGILSASTTELKVLALTLNRVLGVLFYELSDYGYCPFDILHVAGV
jgi:hypothetical protein